MPDKEPNDDVCLLLDPATDLARAAGEKILEIYNSDFTVQEKDDQSPLTAADMASHHAILDGLAGLTPEIPVLSEESASLPFSERSAWQRYWLVDPLDGTREFIKRNGEFTVNIALIDAGVPVLGIVHVPVSGVTYLACRGAGSFKQAADGPRQPIH
ncbi:MAG: 3'(2'),5'-bisphosphate nucleotidase CysQ, partial [Gammaproteobacteria bacterium]